MIIIIIIMNLASLFICMYIKTEVLCSQQMANRL